MIFSVYAPDEHKKLTREGVSKIQFVQEKKNIWALIFPFLWLCYHNLWWELLAYLIYMILPIVVAQQGGDNYALVLSYLPAILLFLEGNALLTYRLERKGWHFFGIVEAENLADAEFKFFNQHEFKISHHETITPVENHPPVGVEQNHKSNPALVPTFGVFE